MIHFSLNVVRHKHQRECVSGRVHEPEHMHVHGHRFGADAVAFGKDVAGGDAVSAVTHAIHIHAHEPVGGHPATIGVCMIPHHGDRRMVVGATDVVFVGGAATKCGCGLGDAGGRSEC